jgi:ATP-binding cassette subfamily C (CFTR/MRP) protein 1
MGPSQAEWVKSVQRRIGVTSTVLRSMKSVKLAGLSKSMGELLQAERMRELKRALKFRWVMVLTNAVCMKNLAIYTKHALLIVS